MSFPKMCVYLQLDLKGAKVEGEQCHAVCMMRSKPVKLYEFFFLRKVETEWQKKAWRRLREEHSDSLRRPWSRPWQHSPP
jgi:hypothetical protein